ncbi:hypothetical protein FPRO05_05180 [Fusarium proliferatum]|uniref:F-box domain-containing protein n=1 Tax=Gibberella intermedia TaxID=948311 RepID=A0A365MPV7_GIBIN|nr:hypothetical protein FPRO05_05180 [Fusarium proliferatum]
MGLLSLPPEMPLSHFPHKETLTTSCSSQFWKHDAEGVETLVNLSETCKALSTFTLPHRYHRIELKNDILHTKEFIAHIRARGHNALEHVRSLSLAYTKAMDDCYNQLPDGQKHRFYFFSMVLPLVPKIQLLHIKLSSRRKIKVSRQTTLESLRYLHIECSDNESQHITHSPQIHELLRQAPNIDTLVIQVDKLCTPPVFTGLGNVKCLKLVNTLLSPRFLTRILDACPQLESFILSYSVRESFRSKFDHATTPKTLPQVLSVRQETLRYLEIHWMPGPIDDSGIEIVGSLKGLTNLETLILVGSGFRFGKSEDKKTVETCLVDLLPPSIRIVSIDSDYMSIIHEPIIALGEAVKQGSFPMLKEVRCYNWLGVGGFLGK